MANFHQNEDHDRPGAHTFRVPAKPTLTIDEGLIYPVERYFDPDVPWTPNNMDSPIGTTNKHTLCPRCHLPNNAQPDSTHPDGGFKACPNPCNCCGTMEHRGSVCPNFYASHNWHNKNLKYGNKSVPQYLQLKPSPTEQERLQGLGYLEHAPAGTPRLAWTKVPLRWTPFALSLRAAYQREPIPTPRAATGLSLGGLGRPAYGPRGNSSQSSFPLAQAQSYDRYGDDNHATPQGPGVAASGMSHGNSGGRFMPEQAQHDQRAHSSFPAASSQYDAGGNNNDREQGFGNHQNYNVYAQSPPNNYNAPFSGPSYSRSSRASHDHNSRGGYGDQRPYHGYGGTNTGPSHYDHLSRHNEDLSRRIQDLEKKLDKAGDQSLVAPPPPVQPAVVYQPPIFYQPAMGYPPAMGYQPQYAHLAPTSGPQSNARSLVDRMTRHDLPVSGSTDNESLPDVHLESFEQAGEDMGLEDSEQAGEDVDLNSFLQAGAEPKRRNRGRGQRRNNPGNQSQNGVRRNRYDDRDRRGRGREGRGGRGGRVARGGNERSSHE